MSTEPSVETHTDLNQRRAVSAAGAARASMSAPGEGAVIDRMENLFERRGFAGTSVDELRDAAGVSLRTLYRRYGSREQMVVAVLRNRAERYLGHLAGAADVRELFERTTQWLQLGQPLGCLFLRARADHPDDLAVEEAVVSYHTALHSRLSAVARADGLPEEAVEELVILHEGVIAAAPAVGAAAATTAVQAALDRLIA